MPWLGDHYIPCITMEYTIRKCVEEMKKLWGASDVVLNNGTRIILHELHLKRNDIYYGSMKFNEDDTIKTIRRFYCTILESKNSETDFSPIRVRDEHGRYKYWIINKDECCSEDYIDREYVIPERVMNQFISANGGIDHYFTIGAKAIMQADVESMFDDFDGDINKL